MNSLLIQLTFLIIPPAQNPDSWGEIMSDWFNAYMNDMWIEALKALATVFWFLEKIGAGITRFLTQQNMWDLLLTTIIDSLKNTMPAILNNLMFSNQNAGGLIWLALIFAGIVMTIPQIGQANNFVHPPKAIAWAVLIFSLFISSPPTNPPTPTGYDIIGLIERIRSGTVQMILDGVGNNTQMDDLVAQPMMADDTDLSDYSFALPSDFEDEYYPEPEPNDYEERNASISDFLGIEMTFEIESEASQNERREKAQTGLAISGLTLIPGIVLLMFGFIFATLTASSLILILFFVTSLPLGFFEFGENIIFGIVKQYTYLWAITLLATILPSILLAAGTLAYPNNTPPDPSQMMAFIPILLIVTIGTSYVSAMATTAMGDTLGIIGTSISSAMAPLNYGGTMPSGGALEGAIGGAGSIAATAALAAVTGGASAALMAGGGALLSKTGGGETAGALATGLAGEKASVFATAAQGRGAGAVAQVAGIQARQNKKKKKEEEEKTQEAFNKKTNAQENTIPQDEQNQVDLGHYTTLDTNDLSSAEKAFTAGEYTTARNHLRRAFGNETTAEQVFQEYKRGGMQKVRRIVNTAQETAQIFAVDGTPLFNQAGNLQAHYKNRAWNRMARRGINNEDAELAATITGATIRAPLNTWNDPLAAHKLAQHISQDAENEHPYNQDMAAGLALHDMAISEGFSEQQLEALFQASQEARAIAVYTGSEHSAQGIAHGLKRHGEWAKTSDKTRLEAGRLAMLITGETTAPPARGPIARNLTQQVLDPNTPHLTQIDPESQKRINALNELASEQGWGENELNALFESVLETDPNKMMTAADIANRALLKENQNFAIGNRSDREQAAALAIGIATGTMPSQEKKQPTAADLTLKTLNPDSNEVLVRDQKTQKSVEALNQLVTDEEWGKAELEPIFAAAQAATANGSEDALSDIASQLHSQNIPVDDKKIRAAGLALQIQQGVMLAPTPVPLPPSTYPDPPPPRTTPTASELTQKTLEPESRTILIRDEKTAKQVERLNSLVTEQNWGEEELTPIFRAAQAAKENEAPDQLAYMANHLHEQGIPLDDKRIRAANLALQIQQGVMLAPQTPAPKPSEEQAWTNWTKLEQEHAQAVVTQTEQIQGQARDWAGQENQHALNQQTQTTSIEQKVQEQESQAVKVSQEEQQRLNQPPLHKLTEDSDNPWLASRDENEWKPWTIPPPDYGAPPPDDYGPPPPDDYGPPPPDDYGPPPEDYYGAPPFDE